MAIEQEERFHDPDEIMRQALDGRQSQMHTGQPGIIVSFDAGAQTATVQPALRANVTGSDGTVTQVDLPVIPDVPVFFPSGGGATFTFPIKAGDECWLAHGSRDLGAWWQDGGTQSVTEARMHDLSDCIAYVGIVSQPKKLSGVSAANAQLRNTAGDTYVELDPSGQIVNIVAPGGMTITTPTLALIGKMTVTEKVTAQQDVIAGGNNVSLVHHTHADPQGGAVAPPT